MEKKVTKSELVKFLKNMLSTNQKWATSALIRIYDNQTWTSRAVGIPIIIMGLVLLGAMLRCSHRSLSSTSPVASLLRSK